MGRARAWAASIATDLGADERTAADFALAISEAATNVVRYAYADGRKCQLILAARRIGERIIFRVRDYGSKFDPAAIRSPNMDGEPTVGGYGVYLMRRLMDKVCYVTTHPIGTELVLVRRRSV